MRHLPKLKWEIDPSTQCPCGSGLPHRKCCRPNAPLIEKSQEFFAAGDHASAERAARAELTRYIGWVLQHTLGVLQPPPGPLAQIIEIDVDALDELAERLAIALEAQGKREGIIQTFEHLAATVPLPGIDERMAFLSCVWLFGPLGQPALAEKILTKWPSHVNIKDVYLLQMYLEMRSASLSPAERIKVIDRILAGSKSVVETLHYSIAKAMLTALTGEIEEAKRILQHTMVAYFPAVAEQASNGGYRPNWTCSQALELQGDLTHDKASYERGSAFLRRIPLAELTPKGQAEVLYHTGRMHLRTGDSAKAIACFSDALARDSKVLPLIYRLEAFCRTGDLEKAKNDLQTLRGTHVPPEYKLEFLRSASAYAVSAHDVEMAKSLAKELKELDLGIMHFLSQRDQLRAALFEFIEEQRSKIDDKVKRPKLLAILQKIQDLAEFFELKPNICGLGLNLNRALERKHKDGTHKP